MTVHATEVQARPLPGAVRRQLWTQLEEAGFEVGEMLPPGGSNARVFALRHDGAAYVAKVVLDEPGLVDGHDARALRAKVAHTRRLRRTSAALAALFVDASIVASGDDWVAAAMPWCDGRPLVDLLEESDEAGRFVHVLELLLDAIATYGYAISRRKSRADVVATDHVARVLRRRSFLATLRPDAPQGRVTLNGRRCVLPEELLGEVAREPRLMSALAPARLHFPAHGDANLRNVLLHSDSCGAFPFHILDPRGTQAHRDVVYDLAKMLFSLTVLEGALANGFEIETSASGAIEIRPRWQRGPRDDIAAEFPDVVERIPAMAQIVAETGPGWRRRLLFAHAVHLVAEAACRLSDRAERRIGDAAGVAARRNVATGFYLTGTLLLNDVLTRETADVAEHLSLAVPR